MHLRWRLVVVLVCFALHNCLANEGPVPDIKAHGGVLDLRQTDLNNQLPPLNGEWGFHWQRLLSPTDTIQRAPAYVQVPSLWKNIKINGQQLPSQGYATYTLTVLLPKKRPRLALLVPDVYCAHSLYINGVLRAVNGKPDSSAGTAIPFWNTQVIVLPNNSDTLRMVLQTANFWHRKGGAYKEFVIGERDTLVVKLQRDKAYDLLLAGCLFMGGLFFFGFFAYGSRDKAILFFSLFCIVYSYRMIGTSLYVLHSVFPDLNWFLTIKLEYLTLTIAVALFARYFHCLYPKDTNRFIVNGVVWFCILYTLIIAVTPPIIFTQGIMVFLGIMFFYIGFAFYICIRAVKFKRVGAVFALLSCGVLLLVFLALNLHYFGVVTTERWIVFAGYVLFFFLQSLVLSHRFAYTLRKAADEAQEGLRAKSEFLSTMSHEIRTPLNVVIGMTHLLLRSTPRKDQEKNLNVLLFSANNLLAIVNDILDYNKIEAGKINFELIPMDIAGIARNIINGLESKATEKQISLTLEADKVLTKKVMGDPTRTSQVIYNLVNNAIKFTSAGWVKVVVKTEALTDTAATITVGVHDTGIGIPPEKQQLIFDRFTQADSSTSRSFGGTGLGLAITKRILELQNVLLQLESEPGKGSVFSFTQTFTLSTEPVEEEQLPSVKGPTNEKMLEGVSILVVEDNPFNVMVAQSLLERTGAIVDVASNGEEALEKVKPDKYKIILMDLNMPVMDGFEATRNLRARGEKLPIIALTASLPAEVEADVQAAGLTGIVVKPFNPDELFRVIRANLGREFEV
jgi:signal transduction histidine kinase/ActR/RegA family two-component response regulator